jgi:uncharacterized protein YndB with AHSA1/START domain
VAGKSSSGLTLTLPSDREIVMTRVFDARPELVWRAMTDPGAIPRWWGPRAYMTVVDRMDVRPGGAWRFVQRAADGAEHAFKGEYREVVPPSRLVYTFEFEGMPGHVALETVTLVEHEPGRTLMTDALLFDTREERDGMIASGMESGARESMDRLAELLGRNPAVVELEALVGEWEMTSPQFPEGRGITTFARVEGGAFLRMRSEIQDSPAPSSTWFIGGDDASDTCTCLYADSRGVSRVYQMTLRDRTWTIWRAAPDFHQRFTATLSLDGTTIQGGWEMSPDGATWSPDFDLHYKKLR